MISLDTLNVLLQDTKIAWSDAVALYHAAPAIKDGVSKGHSALEVITADAPEVLAVIESVANVIAPGSGEAIQLLATVIAHARPMTRDEEMDWMARVPRE